MKRKSSSSKRVDDKIHEAEEAPASLPEEIEGIEEEVKPLVAAEPVVLRPEPKKIATRPNLWVRAKNSVGNRMRWLSIRPLVWFWIVLILILLYLVPLTLWQRGNQDRVQKVMQTVTAQAAQTAISTVVTEMTTPTPIP